MRRNSLAGYLYAMAAGSIWATTGLFVRYHQAAGMDALSIVTWRSLISSHAILLVLFLFNRKLLAVDRADWSVVAMSGVTTMVLTQYTFVYALAHTSVAVAVILNYTAPLWVTIMSRVFFGETVTHRKGLALLLSASGLVLVLGLYDPSSIELSSGLALAAGLASGISFAIQTLLAKRLAIKYHPLTVNGWTGFVGGWVLLGLAWLTLPNISMPPYSVGPVMALFCLGPGITAFYMFTRSLSLIQTAHASIAAMVEPVVAGLLGSMILRESLSFPQIVGMAVVLAGIVLVTTDNAPGVRTARSLAPDEAG